MERFFKEFAKEVWIDEQKISWIKDYIELQQDEIELIASIEEVLAPYLEEIVDRFYQKLKKVDEVRRILTHIGNVTALKAKYKEYLRELLSGNYDLDYFNRRVTIGLKHDFRGVSPELYLGALSLMLSTLMEELSKRLENQEILSSLQEALAKAVFMDTISTLSTYFHYKEKRLKKAQAELKRLNRIYWVLSEINSLIVRERDRQRLLDEASRILHELGGFELVWIGKHDPVTNGIRPVAASGTTGYLNGIVVSVDSSIPEGHRPAAISFRENKVVVVDDTMQDEMFRPWRKKANRFGLKSLISFPLNIEGRTVGVLLLYSKKWAFFSQEEIDLLEEVANDISLALEHIEKREQAERLLFFDQLTGLANQRRFIVTLETKMDAASESGIQVSVLVLDIDKFSNVNHALGFAKGDMVLREIAKRLLKQKTENTWIGRVGADEFGIIYTGATEDILGYIEKVRQDLQVPITLDGEDVVVSFSVGCATYPDDAKDSSMLLNCARTALQEAKLKGTGQINFYSKGLFEKSYKMIKLKRELEAALTNNEFLLYLQPKVNLISRKISGAEALLRWDHPDKGVIAPGTFIPVLEETGLIKEVGRWVIKEACRIIKDNEPCQYGGPKLSLNVSPIQFAQKEFVKELLSIIQDASVSPNRIKIEVTETALMHDTEDALKKLREIDEFGIEISIDDFGTGYSSLSYLKQIPASTLKIDMSFVRGLPDKRDDVEIVKAIISLATNLRKKTVAEGVETREQLVLLTGLGVDEIQGYYFSPPLPEKEFIKYMEEFDEQHYFWKRN